MQAVIMAYRFRVIVGPYGLGSETNAIEIIFRLAQTL
jgi:hypothetical protein